jgi:glycine dehydrogenase subunit 1
VASVFSGPVFHEKVIRLPLKSLDALRSLAAHNVLGGYDLSEEYPELGDAILVCATELRDETDIENYRGKLERVIQAQMKTPCQLKPNW